MWVFFTFLGSFITTLMVVRKFYIKRIRQFIVNKIDLNSRHVILQRHSWANLFFAICLLSLVFMLFTLFIPEVLLTIPGVNFLLTPYLVSFFLAVFLATIISSFCIKPGSIFTLED